MSRAYLRETAQSTFGAWAVGFRKVLNKPLSKALSVKLS
jgi:hypothetical protein